MVTGKWCPCLYLDPQASPSYFLPCPVEEKEEEEEEWENSRVGIWQPAKVNPPQDATEKTAWRKRSPCPPCVGCLILLFTVRIRLSLHLPPQLSPPAETTASFFASSDQYPTFRLLLVSLIILGVSFSWSFLVFSISSFPAWPQLMLK